MRIISIVKRIIQQLSHPSYGKEEFGAIGKNCHIGFDAVLVPKNIFMEDNCIIQNKVNFISHKGKLIIKKFSVISSGCTIIPSTHLPTVGVPFYRQAMEHIGDEDKDIVINEDCWIGANAILLPGCRIGRGAIVAAGAVVTKSVPPYGVVAGCPAHIIAVKFNVNDVLKHESSLYTIEERYDKEYLEELFTTTYSNISSLRKS